MSGELDLDALRRLLDDEPTERWPREDIYPILDRLEEAERARDAWKREADRNGQAAKAAEAKVRRVEAFSAEMRAYCSPHGVAADYASRLDDVLADARCQTCGLRNDCTCTGLCRHCQCDRTAAAPETESTP